MGQVYLDGKDNYSSKTNSQRGKALLSLEMGWDWNSPRNLNLNHLLLSHQVAPPIANIFPKHIQEAHSEVLTTTADDNLPLHKQHALCSWSILSLWSIVPHRKQGEIGERELLTHNMSHYIIKVQDFLKPFLWLKWLGKSQTSCQCFLFLYFLSFWSQQQTLGIALFILRAENEFWCLEPTKSPLSNSSFWCKMNTSQ